MLIAIPINADRRRMLDREQCAAWVRQTCPGIDAHAQKLLALLGPEIGRQVLAHAYRNVAADLRLILDCYLDEVCQSPAPLN